MSIASETPQFKGSLFLPGVNPHRFPRFIENPEYNILNGSFRIAKHSGVLNFRNSFSD